MKIVNPFHTHVQETYDIVESCLCEKVRELREDQTREIKLLTSELLKVRSRRMIKRNKRIFL